MRTQGRCANTVGTATEYYGALEARGVRLPQQHQAGKGLGLYLSSRLCCAHSRYRQTALAHRAECTTMLPFPV